MSYSFIFRMPALMLLASFFLGSCKKTDLRDQDQGPVLISTVSALTGHYNSVVIITGSGFSANPTSNKVQFNKVDAVVQQASTTELTVLVPKAAGSGAITIAVGSRTITGPFFNFIYKTTVSTFAGASPGNMGSDIIPANFNSPQGIACDAAGNIYVVDNGHQSIRMITPSGSVKTMAGSSKGYKDGPGAAAEFNAPFDLTVDAKGNIYVSDFQNNCIRKINPSGLVSTLAGQATANFADGTGTAAAFSQPFGIACVPDGTLFVGDYANHRIRRITPAGVVTTPAGNGVKGHIDGTGTSAEFYAPSGISCDLKGNIYIADQMNNCIRVMDSKGNVSTLAGGQQGFQDGLGVAGQFTHLCGLANDTRGNTYVVDLGNNSLRIVSADGYVTSLAGLGGPGYRDGDGTVAQFYEPSGVACDTQGNIYVADSGNNCIRKITIE